MARYYTYTGFPFINGQGIPTLADGRREWTPQVEALRRTVMKADPMDPTKKVVDRPSLIKVVSHPSIIGAGWLKSFAAEPLDDPRFVEVEEDGPDGDIIHKLRGEDIGTDKWGRPEKGIVHELNRLLPQVKPAEELKAKAEIEIDAIDSDIAGIGNTLPPKIMAIVIAERQKHQAEYDAAEKVLTKMLELESTEAGLVEELIAKGGDPTVFGLGK